MEVRSLGFLAVCLIGEAGALWPPSFHLTDHVIFWTVGHLYATGGSPYDPAAWIAAQSAYQNVNIDLIISLAVPLWPYPPWTGFLFVPFGMLPIDVGLWALHLSYLVVGISSAIVIARSVPFRSWRSQTLALLMVPTFHPFVYSERIGHFDAYLLAGVALVQIGLQRRRSVALVAGSLLLFTKPQVIPIFAFVVLALLLRERRWRDIVVTAGALGAVAAVSIALHPEGVAAVLAGARSRLFLLSPDSINPVPNVWTLSQALGGTWWPLLAAALLLATAAACTAALRWTTPSLRYWTALVVGLIASLVVTPYVFEYDYLVLAPAISLFVVGADALPTGSRAPRLILILVVVLIIPWALSFIAAGGSSHVLSALVPLSFAGLLALSMRAVARHATPERFAAQR